MIIIIIIVIIIKIMHLKYRNMHKNYVQIVLKYNIFPSKFILRSIHRLFFVKKAKD